MSVGFLQISISLVSLTLLSGAKVDLSISNYVDLKADLSIFNYVDLKVDLSFPITFFMSAIASNFLVRRLSGNLNSLSEFLIQIRQKYRTVHQ